MPLESMNNMLARARREHYAVGQYNINGLLWAQGILEAAEAERAPVILAASDRLIDYLGGFKTIVGMVNALSEEMRITVPVALHLDHGTTVDRCMRAIDAGFTSVMIDGSHHPIEDNIAMTKAVVDYAHRRGVSVEAEVGTVGGMEDGLTGGIRYADPDECVRIARETGIDALAAALGSVHGRYQGEPILAFNLMKQISESIEIPLVLHGASGIPVHQIQQTIAFGHAKINVNTETIQAWAEAVRLVLTEAESLYEPRTIMMPGKQSIIATVRRKMQEFQTSHMAH